MKRIAFALLLLCAIAASAAIEQRRPTTDSDPGAGVCPGGYTYATSGVANVGAAAYDSNMATSWSLNTTGTLSLSRCKTRDFTTWQAATHAYTALVLYVNASCAASGADGSTAAGSCQFLYSTNSGGSWTLLASDGGVGGFVQQTFAATLSAGQDLSQVRVRLQETGDQGNSGLGIAVGSATTNTYEMWTEGTYSVTPPAAPSALSGIAAANGLSVALSWTNNAVDATSNTVQRCSGVACTPVDVFTGISAAANSYNDTTTSVGVTYGYKVCAVNANGQSCSSTIYVTTPSPPAVPTGLSITPNAGTCTQAVLNWTDNATTETSYKVQRCTGALCSPADLVLGLAVNTVTYTDATIAAATTYGYDVCAVNAAGLRCSSVVYTSCSLTVPTGRRRSGIY